MPTSGANLLALDVGERRVGVALALAASRLPRPLTVLGNDSDIFEEIEKLVQTHEVGTIVVGWPRNLSGQATAQTHQTQKFVDELASRLQLPIHTQDEAVTSRQAEAELRARGRPYAKGDIDALAATYILEDFLHRQPTESVS